MAYGWLLAVLASAGPSLPQQRSPVPSDEHSTQTSVPRATPDSVASYRIDASLDAQQHVVSGSETIRWRNPSSRAVTELYFHAYMNAFAHAGTRFLRGTAQATRTATPFGTPGSLVISRIIAREHANANLLPNIESHSPNDPNDTTDLRVQLTEPVAPGAVVTLDIDFAATLPSLVERAGYSSTFHAVTQWFPKVARLDAQGRWHHFAYDALAEFSSDFGNYDVSLVVPAEYTIAAPGVRSRVTCAPGRRCEQYLAERVHDFAWFAWDQFVESISHIGSVEVRDYAASHQSTNTKNTLDAVHYGLDHYGARYFPYPYPSLTVVHPPDSARGASGMEYPMLITTGGPWFLGAIGSRGLESVTLHELAHQWFYGVIASDEYEAPFLDEGLASWAEAVALRSRFAAGSLFDASWLEISEAAVRRVHARRYSRTGPLALGAVAFGDFSAISGRVYARFPTLLETIEACFGGEELSRALRAYALTYRFGHPTAQDFLDALRPHLRPRAHRAIAVTLLDDGWVDYSIARIASHLIPGTEHYSNRILVERRGTLDLPVEIEVTFANGHTARRHLDQIESRQWIEWHYSSPIVVATIDPDQRISLDDDLSNQTLRVDGSPWLLRLATVIDVALSMIGALVWP